MGNKLTKEEIYLLKIRRGGWIIGSMLVKGLNIKTNNNENTTNNSNI